MKTTAIIAFILSGHGLLFAQADKPPSVQDPSKQDRKIQDKLEDQEDRIADLEKKAQELEQKLARMTPGNPLTVLNPQVIVIGDFVWRYDTKKVFAANDPTGSQIDNTINLREMEVDFLAAVDPYIDAVGILSVSSEVPGVYGVDVEEFYAVIKSLPVPLWETPPLGTKIKVGRFRTEYGLNNRSHSDDIPQTDRPLVIDEFLGPDGFVSNGISTTSFLPSPGDTALELTLQVLQGGGIGVAEDPNHLAYLANLNFFLPLADEHTLNTTFIGFWGWNDARGNENHVASVEFLYRWKPLRMGEYKSFLVGGQLFTAEHEFQDPVVTTLRRRTWPFGYSVFAQIQLTARIYAGVRWDDTAFLADQNKRRQQIVPYLTWYSSEFFRVRVSYEHTWSQVAPGFSPPNPSLGPLTDGLDTVFLQLVIVFGSHPTEPFWVNK